MRRISLGLAAAMALALLASGCDGETDNTGDLRVTYRVGSGSSSCEDVGIHTVRVQLLASATSVLADELVACNPDDQAVLLTDIEAGRYTVRVNGLDRDGVTIYTGESASQVEVVANQTNGPVSIVLDQVEPSLQLWFGFAEPGGCDRFEVVDVQVVVYRNGTSRFYDETFTCVALTTGSGLLIDELSDTSTYDVRVRGTNSNDEYTYEYNEDGIEVSAGGATEVSVTLTACAGLCTDP